VWIDCVTVQCTRPRERRELVGRCVWMCTGKAGLVGGEQLVGYF